MAHLQISINSRTFCTQNSIRTFLHLSGGFPTELGRAEPLDDHGEALDPRVALVHRPHPDHAGVAAARGCVVTRKQLQDRPGEDRVGVGEAARARARRLAAVSLLPATRPTRRGCEARDAE